MIKKIIFNEKNGFKFSRVSSEDKADYINIGGYLTNGKENYYLIMIDDDNVICLFNTYYTTSEIKKIIIEHLCNEYEERINKLNKRINKLNIIKNNI